MMQRHLPLYLVTLLVGGLALVACSGLTGGGDVNAEIARQQTVAAALTGTAAALVTVTPSLILTQPVQTPALDTPTLAPSAPVTPTVTPPALDTPTLTPLPSAPAAPVCTVVAESLNLRPGPGVAYEPPLLAVTQGAQLRPLAYVAAGVPGGAWIQVQELTSNQVGWVSADPPFVNCTVVPATLPPGVPPPLPTPTNTPPPSTVPPTVTPIPTASYAVLEPGGGGDDDLRGRVLFPGYAAGEIFVDEDNNEALIRNKLVFLADAYNGSAVDQVDFRISGPNGEVYTHLEEDPAYCVFGGGTPDCNVFVFAQNNYTWPNGEHIENDVFYDVDIEIIAFDHRTANWNWSFRVQGVPEVSEPTESTLNVQIVQTGPGTDAPMVSSGLVFQAQAFDSAQGTHDGDGIDHVILSVLRNGVEVYQRRENDPGYCAFSGGEPNCNVFIFAENGNSWPNGPSIEPGPHILRAVAFTGDGRKAEDTMTVDIQLP